VNAIAAAELVLIGWLIYDRRRASADFIALVDRLCQRLQSPAAAVMEHDEAVRARHSAEYAPPAVEPEDDAGYWMSREKLADYAMSTELDERDH
jgi:hypothetical protein